jgi:hypothetical protein
MNRIVLSTTFVLGAATPLLGQLDTRMPSPNRFSLGARVGLGFSAEFENQSQSNPGPPTGGVNHGYDNGYVNVDRGNNAGGRTWNWGYQNASQIVGDAIEFRSDQLNTVPLTINEDSDDLQYGFELNYQRVLAPFFLSGRWGFEGALTYTDIDLEAQRSASGTLVHVTDTYDLGGVVPPDPPYNGVFKGPGPALGATPTRTTPSESAFTTTQQRLHGYAVGIRVGPFFEWTFFKRLGLALSGGLVFAPTLIEYNLSETTTLASGTTTIRGDSEKSDLLYGNYLSGVLRYNFTPQWSIYAGAQYQTLNDLEQTVAEHTARLDQGSTFFGVAGVSFKF